MNKIDKFYEIKNLLQCPICSKKIRFHQSGYVCKKEHRFDISSKGYVNFMQSNKPLKGYDTDFFENRQKFFRAGFYDHIAEEILAALRDIKPETVLDAGCGEGFYSRAMEKVIHGQILAFDIAADAIKIAARGDTAIKWMVADITNIPVKEKSMDCVLDVFTTANYAEFQRVLSEEGRLIKVIPGPNHLKELRHAAKGLIRNKEYSNDEVISYFGEQFDLVERKSVTKTSPINGEQMKLLVNMTPLLFDVDKSKLDCSSISEITIEAEILIGRVKNRGATDEDNRCRRILTES